MRRGASRLPFGINAGIDERPRCYDWHDRHFRTTAAGFPFGPTAHDPTSISGFRESVESMIPALRRYARALAREHVLSSFELLETILEQVGAQPRDWQRGRAARR